MSARVALLASLTIAASAAGCADGRSVVTLTVSADAAIGNIDRLHIVATDDARHRAANPVDVVVGAHTLPPDVTLSLAAPSTIKGGLTLAVTALAADGTTVASGSTDVTIAPSKTFTASVKLTPMLHRALSFVTQPANAKPNQMLTSLQIAIVDDAGSTLTDATDVVSLTLAGGASSAVLSGHIRVAAVAGVATFPDLSVSVAGVGYTLTANAPMADPATSASFDIDADVWQPVNTGLDGGSMGNVVIDPNDGQSLWDISTGGTLWHTKDGGASWVQYGATLPVAAVRACTVSTKSSDVIFLTGTDHALRRSDDGGASWDIVGNNLPPPTFTTGTITVDPKDDTIVYFSGSSGMFKSIDRGTSFAMLNTPASPGTFVIDPNVTTTIYLSAGAIGANKSIYKSTDGGATWNLANSGIPAAMSLSVLAIDPTNGTVWVRLGAFAGTLYKSSDGAASWTAVGANSASVPTSLVVDKSQSSTLYGGYIGAVVRSDDAGVTWQPMTGIPVGATESVRVKRDADGNIWAVPTAGAPYKSTDKHIFAFAGSGIKALYVTAIDVNCAGNNWCIGAMGRGVFGGGFGTSWHEINVAGIDPGQASLELVQGPFVLVQYGGLYQTPDGLTWAAIVLPMMDNLVAYAASGTSIVGVDSGNIVMTSANAGATWTTTTTTLPIPTISGPTTVLIDRSNVMTSYVVGPGFLLKSTNGGGTYADVQPDPVAKPSYYAVAFDPITTTTMYVSSMTGPVYKTTNAGAAWSTVGQGLPTGDYVTWIDLDHMSTMTIYAATASGALYKSKDGAATFKQIAAPPGVLSFKVDPSTPGQILAATSLGVWRTTTGGE